jgi:hypothetical protein
MIDLSNNMKHIQESIIGRKGTSGSFSMNMLKSGYVVRYRDGELGMYLVYEDIKKLFRHDPDFIRLAHDADGFYAKTHDDQTPIAWMPITLYDDNLNISSRESRVNGDEIYDIITVYRVKTKPELLDQESLEKLIKEVKPIKINQ